MSCLESQQVSLEFRFLMLIGARRAKARHDQIRSTMENPRGVGTPKNHGPLHLGRGPHPPPRGPSPSEIRKASALLGAGRTLSDQLLTNRAPTLVKR